jgi:hypothetical protein
MTTRVYARTSRSPLSVTRRESNLRKKQWLKLQDLFPEDRSSLLRTKGSTKKKDYIIALSDAVEERKGVEAEVVPLYAHPAYPYARLSFQNY